MIFFAITARILSFTLLEFYFTINNLKQGLNYCYSNVVTNLILTNGVKWKFYDPMRYAQDRAKGLLVEVNIQNDETEQIVKVFMNLLLKSVYKEKKLKVNKKKYFSNQEKENDYYKLADKIIKRYSDSEKIVSLIMKDLEEKIRKKI